MSYRIAALDIETASLKVRTAILEVGLVVIDIQEPDAYENIEFLEDKAMKFNFVLPLPEQLLLGKHVDPNTLRFHLNNIRKSDPTYEFGHTIFPIEVAPRSSLRKVVSDLQAHIAELEVKELWVNHTSFDCSRLISLAEDLGIEKPLWGYRIERDLATIRTLVPKEHRDEPHTVAHRGTEDAMWNLRELSRVMSLLKPKGMP